MLSCSFWAKGEANVILLHTNAWSGRFPFLQLEPLVHARSTSSFLSIAGKGSLTSELIFMSNVIHYEYMLEHVALAVVSPLIL